MSKRRVSIAKVLAKAVLPCPYCNDIGIEQVVIYYDNCVEVRYVECSRCKEKTKRKNRTQKGYS